MKSNPTSVLEQILAPRSGVRASPTRPSSGGYNAGDRQHIESLRNWLEAGKRAPGAPSSRTALRRAQSRCSAARVSIRRFLMAVADASPAKQGSRMPGTDIPIMSPEELLAANPDRVLLTLPDLLTKSAKGFRSSTDAGWSTPARRPPH